MPASRIACISFSGQMMGCVAVDREGKPLRSALIWADTRAVPQAQRLVDAAGMQGVYTITGHRASSSYSGAKIRWIYENQPEIYAQAYKFLHAKDYVVACLTGKFVTDLTDASGMNLLDLRTGDWSTELLAALDIEPGFLPELHASTDVVGQVTPEAATQVGLLAGTPVIIGGGDGPCAAVGAGVVRQGSAYNYIGSSSWIAIATASPSSTQRCARLLFSTWCRGFLRPPAQCNQLADPTSGCGIPSACLKRLLPRRLKVSPYELMNLQAEKSPPGANGLFFFPYLLGERTPHWNPDARGAFFGLTMAHTRSDLVRATLEGITLNLRTILEAFTDQGMQIEAIRVIGGGANGRTWRQIMADIYGIPVQRPALLSEATSLGAALAGGVGVGIFHNFSVAETLTPVVDTTQPNRQLKPLYDRMYKFFVKAYPAFEPLYQDIKHLQD